MASDPPAIGADTAASCWLCDRERSELCHVHAPPEAEPLELAWVAPEPPAEAP